MKIFTIKTSINFPLYIHYNIIFKTDKDFVHIFSYIFIFLFFLNLLECFK